MGDEVRNALTTERTHPAAGRKGQLRPLYRLRITIGEKEWDVPVIERMIGDHVLIGCDILQHYRFIYDGLDGDDGSFDLYLPD